MNLTPYRLPGYHFLQQVPDMLDGLTQEIPQKSVCRGAREHGVPERTQSGGTSERASLLAIYESRPPIMSQKCTVASSNESLQLTLMRLFSLSFPQRLSNLYRWIMFILNQALVDTSMY